MLILTRKTSETIKIADDVEVVVSEIYHQIKSQPDDANATSNNVCKWSIGSDKHK